jgi:hypothetical protein
VNLPNVIGDPITYDGAERTIVGATCDETPCRIEGNRLENATHDNGRIKRSAQDQDEVSKQLHSLCLGLLLLSTVIPSSILYPRLHPYNSYKTSLLIGVAKNEEVSS